jgi:hypothetical protein
MVSRRVSGPVVVTLVALIVAPVCAVFLLTFFGAFSAEDPVGLTVYGLLVAGATLMTARAFAWRVATAAGVAIVAGVCAVTALMTLDAFGRAVGN